VHTKPVHDHPGEVTWGENIPYIAIYFIRSFDKDKQKWSADYPFSIASSYFLSFVGCTISSVFHLQGTFLKWSLRYVRTRSMPYIDIALFYVLRYTNVPRPPACRQGYAKPYQLHEYFGSPDHTPHTLPNRPHLHPAQPHLHHIISYQRHMI
jgi:hypothetical protein